jgi:hypothetical protein
MLRLSSLSVLVAGVVAVPSLSGAPAGAAQVQPTSKVYELRIYAASAGKLQDLHALFRDEGTRLFAKHGIQNIFAGTAPRRPSTVGE